MISSTSRASPTEFLVDPGQGHTTTVWKRSLYHFAQRIFKDASTTGTGGTPGGRRAGGSGGGVAAQVAVAGSSGLAGRGGGGGSTGGSSGGRGGAGGAVGGRGGQAGGTAGVGAGGTTATGSGGATTTGTGGSAAGTGGASATGSGGSGAGGTMVTGAGGSAVGTGGTTATGSGGEPAGTGGRWLGGTGRRSGTAVAAPRRARPTRRPAAPARSLGGSEPFSETASAFFSLMMAAAAVVLCRRANRATAEPSGLEERQRVAAAPVGVCVVNAVISSGVSARCQMAMSSRSPLSRRPPMFQPPKCSVESPGRMSDGRVA